MPPRSSLNTSRFGERCQRVLNAPPESVLALILIGFIAFLTSQHRWFDLDLPARLAVGRLIRELGYVPHHDPFAFTPLKEVWYDHEWLAGCLFWTVYSWGGEQALFLLSALSMMITALLLFRAARLWSPTVNPWATLVVIIATMVDARFLWTSIVRSQIVTYLFFAAELLILTIHALRRTQAIWLLPPLFVVWTNAHGGVLAGLGLLLLWSVTDLLTQTSPPCNRKRLPIVAALSALALFANPYGPGYVWFLVEAGFKHRPTISEWAPPNFLSPETFLFSALTLGGLLAVERTWRSIPRGCLAYLPLALYKALRHLRLGPLLTFPLATFALAPLCARIGDSLSSFPRGKRLLNAGKGALACFALVGIFNGTWLSLPGAVPPLSKGNIPVDAIAFLEKNQTEGRLLIEFNYGSYAIWRLYPRMTVSLDGRYEETYPESTVEAVSRALQTLDAAAIAALDPTHILVPSDHPRLTPLLNDPAGWVVQYQDNHYSILSRSLPTSRP